MKRRLIALTTAAFLAVTIALGGFALGGFTPTAHAAYRPPPGGGSCSWVQKTKPYHFTQYTYNQKTYAFTEWIEIDGLYSGSFFCGEAKSEVCRYATQYLYGESVTTYYQVGGYVSPGYYKNFEYVSAGQITCYNYSAFGVNPGQGVTVDAQWTTPAGGLEGPWGAGFGF